MKNLKKGFTLIELLVVIAIIGILSSVVLASLNSARSKGADVSIKANLANMKPQAQMYYDDNGNYGTAVTEVSPCTATSTAGTVFNQENIARQIDAARAASGSLNNACASIDTSGSEAWAVAQILKSDNTKSWCVDSTGAAQEFTGIPADAISDTTATCN